MSAGILELDRGVVKGDTWHGLSQYKTQEDFVTPEQAMEVLDVPVEKEQLQLPDGEKVLAYALTRKDTVGKRVVLFPAVGSDYKVLDNAFMLRQIETLILKTNPKVKIDSVGTLWNGQRAFVNLHLDAFQIKGDKSPQITKVMVGNCHGGGGARACAHSHRVVCDNTRRMAEMEGLTNKTFRIFRHTTGVEKAVTDYAQSMTDFYTGLTEMKNTLNCLADASMDVEAVQAFLVRLFPGDLRVKPTQAPGSDEETLSRKDRNAIENRAAVLNQLESDQDLDPVVRFSRYGMLQAVTWWADHHRGTRTLDDGSRWWDGLYGTSDEIKQAAMQLLMDDLKTLSPETDMELGAALDDAAADAMVIPSQQVVV